MLLNMFLTVRDGSKLTKNIVKMACSECHHEIKDIKFKYSENGSKSFKIEVFYHRDKKADVVLLNRNNHYTSLCLSADFEDYSFLVDTTARLAKKLKKYTYVVNPDINQNYNPFDKLIQDYREIGYDMVLR